MCQCCSCKARFIARTRSIGLDHAHRTLRDATLFLGGGLRIGARGRGVPARIEGRHRAKVIGNGLRELDRFLSVLLDEVALTAGISAEERDALGRMRNTATKLGVVSDRLALPPPDLDRLRALARCRDCLFYCDGIVRRGDERHGVTLRHGWPPRSGGAGRVAAIGQRLDVAAADIAWICGFYDRIAADLVRRGDKGFPPGK